MTWGVTVDVPAPVEVYDAVHAELLRRTGGAVEGLLVHLARPTAGGFQVVEVWESRAAFARYEAEVVAPVMAGVGGPPPAGAPVATEFDVRGLVLPRGGVAV
ncbi:hypothetical protein GCU56_20610 [Geodermatophilus sabuli]|uniref:Antibiotic biosynthesis monooxygenase n=1 Tax=Geodermatophilus sabuli TaxID=1564158 RepID=A0A7K3W607_9ACTN|nr:hypothetical protein [Geodermatophilus sabuli]NEK60262.1 hypothetical protein [Geodermatophilus sabuli]